VCACLCFFSVVVDFLVFAPVFHTLTLFDCALTHYVIFESVLAAATGGVGTKSRRALEKGGGAEEFRLQRQGEQLAPAPLLPPLPAMLLSGQALQNLSFVFKKKQCFGLALLIHHTKRFYILLFCNKKK